MAYPFCTLGHGRRSIDELVDLLRGLEVGLLADVRSVPRSRSIPQYNLEVLPQSLAASGLGYQHIAALGGLRGGDAAVGAEVNGFWENASFHNYADSALGTRFRDGLSHLRELGGRQRCAVMCAETV